MRQRSKARGFFFTLLFAACSLTLAAQAAPRNGAASEVGKGGMILSSRDVFLYPPEGGSGFFRFSPDVNWRSFDRNIVLSAAAGESRSYVIETRIDAAPSTKTAYIIDKRPPFSPRASPGTGVYRADTAIYLYGEDAAPLRWALLGPGREAGGFAVYDPANPPRILLPPSGSATYTLIAYAEDGAGNRSEPSRFVYRIAAPALDLIPPESPSPCALASDPGISAPTIAESEGLVELVAVPPPGARFIVCIAPDLTPTRFEDFISVAANGGNARFPIPVPYGWSGELRLFYGLATEASASFNPTPLLLRLSYPPSARRLLAEPETPLLVSDVSGRGSFLFFPSYEGKLFLSLDGASPIAYEGPLALPPGGAELCVSWYGTDAEGRSSAAKSAVFSLPRPTADPYLVGAAEGAILGASTTLEAGGASEIRYELRLDGSLPPEPSSSSSKMGTKLEISCPDGQEASVVLRYRAFSEGIPGESKILRFGIDRKPPPPPLVAELPPHYTDKPRDLKLIVAQNARLFVSNSVDASEAPFVESAGILSLAGEDSGPVSYWIRAYTVDATGNRSAEMNPISVVIDRSSIYVAEDAAEGGDGSPNKPLRGIDAALAAAIRDGKRSIHLRGSFALSRPFSSTLPIEIDAGYAPDWTRQSGARASIRLGPFSTDPGISFIGASLIIRGIDLRVAGSRAGGGNAPALSVKDGAISLTDCGIVASGDGDILLIKAVDASVSIARSNFRAERAMSFSAVEATRSSISFSDSVLTAAAGVRAFGGFDLEGGSLELSDALVESYADLGASLISLRASSIRADRILFKVEGGGGFLRLGRFADSVGEIRNSRAIVAWGSGATLFEIEGRGPSFKHDSFVAESERGGMLFFSCSDAAPEIWNSILECPSGGGILLESGSAPVAGSLVANCLWGFDRLVAGAASITTLVSLNSLNAGSPIYSSRPSVSEPPSRTFAAPVKSIAPLSAGSLCIDAALPLGGDYARDFRLSPRPSGSKDGPDIGAEELTKE